MIREDLFRRHPVRVHAAFAAVATNLRPGATVTTRQVRHLIFVPRHGLRFVDEE